MSDSGVQARQSSAQKNRFGMNSKNIDSSQMNSCDDLKMHLEPVVTAIVPTKEAVVFSSVKSLKKTIQT